MTRLEELRYLDPEEADYIASLDLDEEWEDIMTESAIREAEEALVDVPSLDSPRWLA